MLTGICRDLALAILLQAALMASIPAQALDPFEIQVYDADTLDPGVPMIELHPIWKPAAAAPPVGPGSGAVDPGLLHLTLEPQIGVVTRVELGAYFETSLWPDGSYRVEGGKLRLKGRLPEHAWPFEAALNVELGLADPISGDPVWGAELRPILAKHFGPCFASLNPIVGFSFQPAAVPTFEPAAKLNCEVVWRLAPGLEYYGDLGPIDAPLPLAREQQLLFYTLDVYTWPRLELGVGAGEPLTRASGPWVLNANLGWRFD